ncbi:DUF6160 family protein, partial [Acinetobacter baumannii]
ILILYSSNMYGDEIYLCNKASVVPTGLRIQNNSTQGMNVYAQGVHLGAAGNASIGDLEIQGLNVGKSTITISGH